MGVYIANRNRMKYPLNADLKRFQRSLAIICRRLGWEFKRSQVMENVVEDGRAALVFSIDGVEFSVEPVLVERPSIGNPRPMDGWQASTYIPYPATRIEPEGIDVLDVGEPTVNIWSLIRPILDVVWQARLNSALEYDAFKYGEEY